ncbi:MAG: hypothetical protein U9N85_13095 [Bacteroidota bacterium]|nr:hypothetical protein [Bacteroidota bacterium]
MQNHNIRTVFLTILLLQLSFFSCKNNNNNPIPDVFVDIEIDLNNPDFYSLQAVGNYEYITGGVNGIILYRKSFDEFMAFERTCPHDPEIGIVTVDAERHTAVDSIACGSEFSLLIDGAVTKGPSGFPLKFYKVVYNNQLQVLRITN